MRLNTVSIRSDSIGPGNNVFTRMPYFSPSSKAKPFDKALRPDFGTT